jgi:hypothetical protein
LTDIIAVTKLRCAEYVACVMKIRCTQILVGKTLDKRAFGRPRLRWENNAKMDFMACKDVN